MADENHDVGLDVKKCGQLWATLSDPMREGIMMVTDSSEHIVPVT